MLVCEEFLHILYVYFVGVRVHMQLMLDMQSLSTFCIVHTALDRTWSNQSIVKLDPDIITHRCMNKANVI